MRLLPVMRKNPRGWWGRDRDAAVAGGEAWRATPGKTMWEVRSRGRDGVEHFLRVAGDFHLAPFPYEFAVGVDQERAAHHAHVALAVQHLFMDHVERPAPGFVGVGHQREGQRLFFREPGMRGDRIARDADNLRTALAKLRVEVAEILRLGGTAGGAVL